MTPIFKGQHANETVLGLIEQSGIYWLKLALRWWWALTFFFVICAIFVDLLVNNRLGVVSVLVVVEFLSFLLLVLWHLKQRDKRKLYITNERIVRFNGKEQFSMNLDEIRDIQVRRYKKFSSIGEITFSAVTPLRAKQIPEVQALGKYVNEILRLRQAGSSTFPKYEKERP
jgi:hypothetical protein